MKKSQIIKVMCDSWIEYIKSPKARQDGGIRKGMEYVLKQMEQAGMQPPPRRVYIDDSFDAVNKNEWEEE